MNRAARQQTAQETLEILQAGRYTSPNGNSVELSESLRTCLGETEHLTPAELEQIRQAVLATPASGYQTTFEIANETTLSGIARLISSGAQAIAALNFASAKNPGGGFLSGSEAQEESLARSSGLHASLSKAWKYYEEHRASESLLYSDAMILSPNCPVIRDDNGTLLDRPHLVTFISSAAPNAGAAAKNRPHEVPEISRVLTRRAEYVLALAASRGYRHLVLGAWGCGVFRNDPAVVADSFMQHFRKPEWSGRFDRVVFSVFDRSPDQTTFTTFQQSLKK